ncbi:MAG: hypothetical protein ACRCTU_17430 [Zoogloea sp.]|uniref:hypothetical protein n=1 Tax=Zoogloea sp. TaxID=49181 RepID=UPI003F308FC8
MNALDAALNATLDTSATPARSLQRVIPSMAASDGAGSSCYAASASARTCGLIRF